MNWIDLSNIFFGVYTFPTCNFVLLDSRDWNGLRFNWVLPVSRSGFEFFELDPVHQTNRSNRPTANWGKLVFLLHGLVPIRILQAHWTLYEHVDGIFRNKSQSWIQIGSGLDPVLDSGPVVKGAWNLHFLYQVGLDFGCHIGIKFKPCKHEQFGILWL